MMTTESMLSKRSALRFNVILLFLVKLQCFRPIFCCIPKLFDCFQKVITLTMTHLNIALFPEGNSDQKRDKTTKIVVVKTVVSPKS